MTTAVGHAPATDIESPYAWLRLAVAVTLSAVGGVGMWSVVVALPAIQAEFGVDRAAASLPYTMAMIGFAGGGVVIGRLADRFVGMYVNRLTEDYGDEGREAVGELLRRGEQIGAFDQPWSFASVKARSM